MKPNVFLLADDDTDDTELFCEALAATDKAAVCHCVGNGKEALQILHEMNPKPNLIVLDVNMPVMDGWQCLKKLKADERYNHIPVMMYSTSSHQKEVETAMSLGALCFFTKPVSFDELKEILGVIAANIDSDLLAAINHFSAINTAKNFACTDR